MTGAPLEFLESFFAGYDYRGARQKATERLAKRNIVQPDIYDPDKALKDAHLPIRPGTRIGIPALRRFEYNPMS